MVNDKRVYVLFPFTEYVSIPLIKATKNSEVNFSFRRCGNYTWYKDNTYLYRLSTPDSPY